MSQNGAGHFGYFYRKFKGVNNDYNTPFIIDNHWNTREISYGFQTSEILKSTFFSLECSLMKNIYYANDWVTRLKMLRLSVKKNSVFPRRLYFKQQYAIDINLLYLVLISLSSRDVVKSENVEKITHLI